MSEVYTKLEGYVAAQRLHFLGMMFVKGVLRFDSFVLQPLILETVFDRER